MQRDRGLAGPRDALNDQCLRLGIANDRILIALDGGDDVLHAVIAGLGERILKHVIDDVHADIEHELHLAVADAELPLERYLAGDRARGGLVLRRPGFVIVEQRRDRRAPVMHPGLLRLLVAEIVDADIVDPGLIAALAAEIEAAEPGRFAQLLQLQGLRAQHVGGAHHLVDRLAHGRLVEVVHVAAMFPHVVMRRLDVSCPSSCRVVLSVWLRPSAGRRTPPSGWRRPDRDAARQCRGICTS